MQTLFSLIKTNSSMWSACEPVALFLKGDLHAVLMYMHVVLDYNCGVAQHYFHHIGRWPPLANS